MSSGVIASTGHASTQASQSMHSSRVDEKLADLVVVGLVWGRVNAVDRTDLDARVVLHADARLVDDVGHVGPPRAERL